MILPITHVSMTPKVIDRWEADQVCWDHTVLCAFEATTGLEGVFEDSAAFEAWLDTPAAQPALAALASARRGEWISPREWGAAFAFWINAARAAA